MQGVWVPCLVRELRSDMPLGQENIKQKQHCNKFNTDFKKLSTSKKKKKKEEELVEAFEQGSHTIRSE